MCSAILDTDIINNILNNQTFPVDLNPLINSGSDSDITDDINHMLLTTDNSDSNTVINSLRLNPKYTEVRSLCDVSDF